MKSKERHNVLSYFDSWMFNDVHVDKLCLDVDGWYIVDAVLSKSMDLDKDLLTLDSIYHRDDIIQAAVESASIFGNERIEHIAKHYQISPASFKKYFEKGRYEKCY